jgi:ATP-dependent DNA helicase RecG
LLIAEVFKQIGNADDLGSGVRNLVKYTKIYSNSKSVVHDEDIFRVIIPTPQATLQATQQAIPQDERTKKDINFLQNRKNHLGNNEIFRINSQRTF